MNIFKFEFKRLLKSCIIWSLVCGVLITLFMSLFPTMEDMGMQQIVNDKNGRYACWNTKGFQYRF